MSKMKKLDKLLNYYTLYKLKKVENEKIKVSERQKIVNSVHLSEEEKKTIDDFYKNNYGKKIKQDWHRLYQGFTGEFHQDYFPDILFSTVLEPKLNPFTYRYVLDDKALLSLYTNRLNGLIRTPKVYGGFENGVFYNNKNEIIEQSMFLELMKNIGSCVIKKTQDTSSGRDVKILNIINGKDLNDNRKLEEIVQEFNKNPFVIQEMIKAHQSLKDIYANSINTFRIVTYIWNSKIYSFPVVLRMGQGGNTVDNAHAGGLFVGLDNEGNMMQYAYMDETCTKELTRFEKHPDTNYLFANGKISYLPNLIDTAKKMHVNALSLGMISWDITVDEKGKFVLIEANTNGQTLDFLQEANGKPAFGENTADILRWLNNNS